jgi:hypothetical protein
LYCQIANHFSRANMEHVCQRVCPTYGEIPQTSTEKWGWFGADVPFVPDIRGVLEVWEAISDRNGFDAANAVGHNARAIIGYPGSLQGPDWRGRNRLGMKDK